MTPEPAQPGDDHQGRPVAARNGHDIVVSGGRGAVRPPVLREVAERALDSQGVAGVGLGIKLASDRTLRRLNRSYRGVDQATDVLSFEAEGRAPGQYLGDIVISLDTARRQAAAGGLSLERELQELVLHGCLHLLGYDHDQDDGEMDQLELELRRRLLGPRVAAR